MNRLITHVKGICLITDCQWFLGGWCNGCLWFIYISGDSNTYVETVATQDTKMEGCRVVLELAASNALTPQHDTMRRELKSIAVQHIY